MNLRSAGHAGPLMTKCMLVDELFGACRLDHSTHLSHALGMDCFAPLFATLTKRQSRCNFTSSTSSPQSDSMISKTKKIPLDGHFLFWSLFNLLSSSGWSGDLPWTWPRLRPHPKSLVARGVHNWLAIAVDVLKLPNLKALTGRWSTFAVVHHQHGLEVASWQERMGLTKCITVLYPRSIMYRCQACCS